MPAEITIYNSNTYGIREKHISKEDGMLSEPNDSFFIGDTIEGKVFLSRTSPDIRQGEPRQLLFIFGKDHVRPPNMVMTRSDFKKWRDMLQEEGCRVELKFAS